MGKVSRSAVIAGMAIGVFAVAYLVVRGVSSWRQGYSWSEMDWSQRGHTSISDFFAASDIGKREVMKGGRKCVEYFAYKDGLTVKTVCSKEK